MPVKLKPFSQWRGECVACKVDAYESFATRRQILRLSGLWIEIDTASRGDCAPCDSRDPNPPGNTWQATRQSLQAIVDRQETLRGFVISEEEARRAIFCSHMIEKHTFLIGVFLALARCGGLLKNFPRNKPPAKDADPLVGKLFMAVVRCGQCSSPGIEKRGEVIHRIAGADAYLVQPYSMGQEFRPVGHVCRVEGHEMSYWRFYDSAPLMQCDEQRLLAEQNEHEAEHRPKPRLN